MFRKLFIFLIIPSLCLAQITKPSSIDFQSGSTDFGQVRALKCDGTSISCTVNNQTGTISLAGGSNPWTESGTNLYSPITDTVTVGRLTTSYNQFTSNADGSLGNGISSNYIPAGQGGIDSFTKLMLHFDNNVTDSELTPKTITNVGGTFDNVIYKFGGYSLALNGSGQYVTVPASTDLNFGTGDFTIDFWMYLTSLGVGGNDIRLGDLDAGGAGNLSVSYIQSNGTGTFTAFTQATDNSYNTVSATGLTTNTWYHLAFVRNTTTLTFYVNGTSVGTSNIGVKQVKDLQASTFSIGRAGDYPHDYFPGKIDEFRISKGIARWTSNFTPPASPYNQLVGYPEYKFSVNGVKTANIWTDGANSDQLTFTVGATDYHTIDSSGNEKFKGTFTNTTSTTGIGWSVKTGANTACNTTCGSSACVFGFDTALAGSDVVNCASAIADTCLCAGS